MQTLKGRTCLFSGATGMIGRGAVRALAEGGMNVALMTHMLKDAQEVADSMSDCPGKVFFIPNTVSHEDALRQIAEECGSIDVVVSSTGVLNKPVPFEEITKEQLEEKLLHQTSMPFRAVQAALPYLEKSSAPRVIFTSSAGARNGFTGESIIDNIARGAVISMTYSLARELMDRHITVNCIARSGLINDHTPSKPDDHDVASIADRIPVGHIGTAEEFGALVAYIASEEAGYVTGQIFDLSGGLYIG